MSRKKNYKKNITQKINKQKIKELNFKQIQEEEIYRRQLKWNHGVSGLDYKPKYDTGEVIE